MNESINSGALSFWNHRPYLPVEVKDYIDETVKDWMDDPDLRVKFNEPCLRKALEDACLKLYHDENEDDFDLPEEIIEYVAAIAEVDTQMYSLIEKGLLQAYETETGELMIWYTELGMKVVKVLDEHDKVEKV